jgi:hypothetical protein
MRPRTVRRSSPEAPARTRLTALVTQPKRAGVGEGLLCQLYNFSSRLALPLSSFSLSSPDNGRVSVHFAPGGLSTNG